MSNLKDHQQNGKRDKQNEPVDFNRPDKPESVARRGFLKRVSVGALGITAPIILSQPYITERAAANSDDECSCPLNDAPADCGGDLGESGVGFNMTAGFADIDWFHDAASNDNLEVLTVTNLDPSGEGSLEWAANYTDSPSVVVFEVGGVIDNERDTYIRTQSDHTYIAGQTAPYPGITVIRGGIRNHGDNVVIRHISMLPGDDIEDAHKARAFTFDEDGENVIVDHCTFAWAPDTNINVHEGSDRTVINSLNVEPLNDSSHPDAPHGYGVLFDSDGTNNNAFLGNLRAHSWKRNPWNASPSSDMLWANNYQFNWGDRVYHGTSSDGPSIDWIGTVVEEGPDTDHSAGIFNDTDATVFWEDNEIIPSGTPLNDENITYESSPINLPSGFDPDEDLVAAADLEDFLVPIVGPRPADRAPFEQRIIDDFENRDGQIIDNESDLGGYPDYEDNTRSLSIPSDDSEIPDWLDDHSAAIETRHNVNP